jgi:hypothetical protein
MELSEIHQEVSQALEEIRTNRDSYAAIVKLAESLELVLRYLEENNI